MSDIESTKRPAIFFDRDNTLIVADGYLGDPQKVQLVPNAADTVARARALGFVCIVFSNQSGVARGLFDEAAVHAVNHRLDRLLAAANPSAIIDRHEFCPYHPEATLERYRQDSEMRKPRPGMILHAAQFLGIDLSRSWVIGDAPRDIEAASAAGCRAVLFQHPNLPRSSAADQPLVVKPQAIVDNLMDAIRFIEAHSDSQTSSVTAQPREDLTADPAPAPPHPPVRNETPRMSGHAHQHEAAAPPAGSPPVGPAHSLETMLNQILQEVRRLKPPQHSDFSVTKLLAGITQVLVLAVLFFAYLRSANPDTLRNTLLFALVLQTLTIALLIMHRQK